MNKEQLQEMTGEKLIAALYWVAVRATNETNSRRGLTKQTVKEEAAIWAEVAARFNLDIEILKQLTIEK